MSVVQKLRALGGSLVSDVLTRMRVHQRWTAPRHHNRCSTVEHPEVLFYQGMQSRERPKVLEIGSRRIVAPVDRDKLGKGAEYVGMDILAGPNVGVVGDAHDLRPHFADGSFDGVISLAVFEHIAMPWKVALEINRVLKPGGLVYIATHHVYPIHELPWDFYRYGFDALAACFGPAQGFEPLSKLLGWSTHVFPEGGLVELDAGSEHFLFTGLLARKTAEYDRETNRWDVDYRDALPERHEYPEGTYVKTADGERYGGPAQRQHPRVVTEEEVLARAKPDSGSTLVIAAEGTPIPALSGATIERVRVREAAADLRAVAERHRGRHGLVLAYDVLENVHHPWVEVQHVAACIRVGGLLVAREHTSLTSRADRPDLFRFTSESLPILYHPRLGLRWVESAFVGPLLVVADESERQGLERNNRTFRHAIGLFRKTGEAESLGVWPSEGQGDGR